MYVLYLMMHRNCMCLKSVWNFLIVFVFWILETDPVISLLVVLLFNYSTHDTPTTLFVTRLDIPSLQFLLLIVFINHEVMHVNRNTGHYQ